MAKPTLLIGIGTSGLRVLEHTQKFYFEHTGMNKPGSIEYIYLETDENSYPSTTVVENEISRIYLDLSDKETKINNLKDRLPDDENDWVPDPNFIKDAGKGAGGMPAFGRAALWSYPNFDEVKDGIRSAFNRINSHNQRESDNSKPAVFITGSLTGGTGSGVFLDLAFMVKNQIPGLEDVYGLFLTPGRNYVGKDNILYCNTLSSIVSLEKYNQANQSYKLRWPDSTTANLNALPFEMSHIISQDRNDGTAQVQSLGGLYKIAGLWMFLNIFGLREKRNTRLTDGKGGAFIDKYGSFGIAAVQYPKRQLEELLGVELSMTLIKRWVDSSGYYHQGSYTDINSIRQKVDRDTRKHFEESLSEALDMLDATTLDGEIRIINDLKEKARRINKKDFTEPSEYHFIKKWFTSNGENNYYTAIKNNLRVVEDDLIQKIHELVVRTLDRTENLYITKIQLETIVKTIREATSYWGNSLKISPKPERWENLLEEKQINWILKSRYKLIGEQDAVVFDRLKTTFQLMKIHLLGERIKKIRDNITDESDAIKTFSSNHTLPKVRVIERVIRKLKNVVESSNREGDVTPVKHMTLKGRFDEIVNDLNDETIPILRVFKDGSSKEARQRCYEQAKSTYFNKVGSTSVSKKTIIGEDALWEYLTHPTKNLHTDLFEACVRKFEIDVIDNNCFEDMDIAQYISHNPKECGKMAQIAKTALVMVNNDSKTDFVEGKGIPRLVIGKNKNQISQVFQSLNSDIENNYLQSFKEDEDGIWTNEEINNIIIFYTEQGYMSTGETFNPLKHLRYIDDIKRIYVEEKNRYSKARGADDEVWNNLRSPYLTKEEAERLSKSDNQ